MSELSSGGGGASAEYDYDDGAEDNFDKLSDVERIRYFKDRGIDVNVPDSKLKAMVAAAAGDLVPCFTYVRIPANDADLVEELTAMLPLNEDGCVPAGDQIPGLVKPLFADRGGGVDEGLLGEHARAQLGSSAGAVTSRAFHEATVHGSVETYALVRPAAANANAGVYLYLDEVGVIKQLPVNARANALAHACGHAVGTVSFHGDIFVGRVQAVPSPMRNTDFKIADMNSDAAWVRSAPEENYRYAVGMKEVEKALASKGNSQQLNVGGFEEGDLPRGEGKAGRYAWSQTKDDVEVSVPLPKGTRAKDLSVSIKTSSLRVGLGAAALMDVVKLNGPVNVDDSTWTIDSSGPSLVITLEKQRPGIWRLLDVDGDDGV